MKESTPDGITDKLRETNRETKTQSDESSSSEESDLRDSISKKAGGKAVEDNRD